MEPCQALPKLVLRTSATDLHEGYVQDLGPADTSWIPIFEGTKAQAVVSIPGFGINQEISERSSDARQKCLFGIWKGIPDDLKDRLRRIGAAEERGETLKFRMPLRIAYTFHAAPSLLKQLALASVDAKLPKPYLLALQPLKNIAHAQWAGFFDEGDTIHCRRFPGGYLLRKQTGALGHNPLYALDVVPQAGAVSTSLCLFFLAPDPRSKTLAISLSFHIFVDTDIVRLDIPTIHNLWQGIELCAPTSLYKTAGIDNARAFHQKLFPDLFAKAAYNPVLGELLDNCCFGSLLDLEKLRSNLRDMPSTFLFIADDDLRGDLVGNLTVPLEKGEIVPQIDLEALTRENQRSINRGVLDAACRDAERYNAFAQALWQHVLNEIVTSSISINTSQPSFSIKDAEDVFYILDGDNEADKHLIDTATRSDSAQLQVLSLTQNASERNYFGPQYVILPETAQNISAADRIKMQPLIACLYQYHHDRIAITADRKYIANFLKDAKQKSDVAYHPVVDLRQLDRYQIAEDTNNGKFSCDAVFSLVPEDLKSLPPLAFKNRFARILLRGLQVLLSPIRDSRLKLINMTIPDAVLNSVYLSGDLLREIQRVASAYNGTSEDKMLVERHQPPVHYIYYLLNAANEVNCSAIPESCSAWLLNVARDPLAENGPPSAGLFFNKSVAYYVVSRLQQLTNTCLSSQGEKLEEAIGGLVGAFHVIYVSFGKCLMGRFEGMIALFPILALGDPAFLSLPLKQVTDSLMNIALESRFSDVFSKVSSSVAGYYWQGAEPHIRMTFRRALEGLYGMMGGMDDVLGALVFFGDMLRSAKEQGIPTDSHFPAGSYPLGLCEGNYPQTKQNCKKLMRLVMTPEEVIKAFAQNRLSHSAAQRFLREKHRLPDAQISILLRDPTMRRQVIADMLKEYGYLMEKH
jgi:hypothetical protein